LNNDNKTFCILPWVHMHMWPNGITYPCCLATNDYTIGNTNTSTFKELWNSERMRELRRNMLDGKPTSGCSRCYEHEENGSRSMRMNEPLIMDEHYKILEHLIEIGKTDIQIAYNTNFSKLKYKRKDVIDLWQHFEHVKVGASLDAMGKRAELMRAGTKWDDMMRNRERILEEASHVQFQISSTVSAYNAWHAADFYSDWIDRGWVSPDQVDINILLFPEWQRPEILPEAFRKEIQEKLRSYSEKYDVKNVDKNGRSYSALNALIDCLNKDKSEFISEFISQNDRMDAVREEKLFDIFPELEVLKNV
jgi:radical SAM protein with 4Fe4S-binding SPASM domain